ncbi:hypothetical protein L198_04781 [Cryptococcus wingfieldii CBS 7118]|uniref:Uncharacterized protein n=1 Tax=Cryptococcus wingfieldii CBS 7118 TaxID=1295528 RepID=A0A1E3J3W7_9TREE|nr:hypothetical protein L198_04781 [Cryptococcus wingfieldii CBS 7118]ODN94641.1 hypothetical protein L198_04781 [Cryptococcus wingfieldii CBS 7118]
MSGPQEYGIRSELMATKILLEGSLPALSSTGANDRGENYGPFLQRRVDQPIIESRFTLRSFRDEGIGGGETAVPVPLEVERAADEYVSSVGACIEPLQSTLVDASMLRWGDAAEKYQEYNRQAHINQLTLLSDVMHGVFLDDGGNLNGPDDRPMDPMEYEDKLERAVASAKGVDELCCESAGTIKLAFTTGINQPTRLARSLPSSAGGHGGGVNGWNVSSPQASVSCLVMDDCPEWIHKNKSAQISYSRAFFSALNAAVPHEQTFRLGRMTTAEDFMVDTNTYEHGLFRQAAYKTVDEVSFLNDEGNSEENSQLVDGHLVKAAWVDASMFNVLSGSPLINRQWYFRTRSEYKRSIEEGLDIMRREVEGTGASDTDQSGKSIWGTWTEL